MVAAILRQGISNDLLSYQNKDGNTPLHVACMGEYFIKYRNDQIEIIKILIDQYDACVKITNSHQQTPLHIASMNEYISPIVVDCLLRAGAQINCIDKDGCTPLQYAIARTKNNNDKKDIIDMLNDSKKYDECKTQQKTKNTNLLY